MTWLPARPPARLAGAGLVLRRFDPDQAAEAYAAVAASLPELTRWMPWASAYGVAGQGAAFVEQAAAFDAGRECGYLVTRDGEVVGGTGMVMTRTPPGTIEVGYWTRSDVTGQAIATRAAALVVLAAFDLGPEVRDIEIHHDEANTISGVVAAKLGFTRVATGSRPVTSPGESGVDVTWRLSREDHAVAVARALAGDTGRLNEATYDRTAQRYVARWGDHPDPSADAKARLFPGLAAGAVVVDVGCGAGWDLAAFAAHGCTTVGVDRSVGMLAEAAASSPTSALVQADLRALPLANACADLVWTKASLLHLTAEEFPVAAAEIRRVLRPAGRWSLTLKRGDGDAVLPVDDTDERRYFRYWQPDDLDAVLTGGGWRIEESWEQPDSLGRHPWLCRTLCPEA